VTDRNVAGLSSWQVLSKEQPTTETSDLSKPLAVHLDGKEVIAMAYVQRVQGSGTQKAHGQVNFQWIDPADGKVVSSVVVDLTSALGPDQGGENIISQAYDAANGQLALGISPGSEAAGKKAGEFTVFADPQTKKSTVIPFVRAAGLLSGVIAGVTGIGQEGATDLAVVSADAAPGTITKKTPVKMNYLSPVGTGAKRAYLSGSVYVPQTAPGKLDGYRKAMLYSVDIATGAITSLTSAVKDDFAAEGYTCWPDQKTSVVCNGSHKQEDIEIFGMDDTTGKKVPTPTPTPTLADGANPGATPTDGATPSETAPSDGTTPTTGSGNLGGWGDTSLLWGKPKSPAMVSQYGSVYLLDPGDKAPLGTETILVVQKAIA
jgi:hypothetical protein